MNRNFVIFTALILVLFLAAGCGSGGSSGTSGSTPSGSGNMQLQVSYPQDQKESMNDRQDLYIQYYLIDLYPEGSDPSLGPIQTIRIEYPNNTATFANLEYGSYRIEVGGYDAGNNKKTAGTGYGEVTVESSPDVTVTMTPVGSPTPSPTSSISPSPTVSPTESPSPSPSPTVSPSPSPSPSPLPGEIRTQLCSPPRLTENSSRSGSYHAIVTNDNKLVAFRSNQQLVSDHGNSYEQIYLFNVDSGTVKLISRDPQGNIGNNRSGQYSLITDYVGTPLYISGNGEFVVFNSLADNLLGSGMDVNGKIDIFLYDVVTDTISMISTKSGSTSEGSDGNCIFCAISDDGTSVVFDSDASNLLQSGIASGSYKNIYRATLTSRSAGRPIATQKMELISNSYSSGAGLSEGNNKSLSPGMSRDGRFIVYQSTASNLVSSPSYSGSPPDPFQVYICDTNNSLETRTRMISVSNENAVGTSDSGNPKVSDDGSRVVFHSGASNLGPTNPGKFDIYLWQRNTGLTLVSYVTGGTIGDSYNPTISGDGRYIAFQSSSTGFVQDDTNGSIDCFLYDTQDGIFRMLSVNSAGIPAEQSSGSNMVFVSKDGKVAVFNSYAKNLVDSWPAPSTSGVSDVFLRQWMK